MIEEVMEAPTLPVPMSRDLFFTQQVDQDSICELVERVIKIEKNDKYLVKFYNLHGISYIPQPINIYIDSYGGNVLQAFGLVSIMTACKTPIHTIVTGTAMSAGFLIAITGHRRFCYKDSTYMYHQVSTGVYGTLKELEAEFIEASRLQERIEFHTKKRTNLTEEKLEEIYQTRHDFFFDANDAVTFGCADEIIE